MPNRFYRNHSRMRPNFSLLRAANESFDFCHAEGFDSIYSASHLLDMAVYDQLGGFPSRVAIETAHLMDRYQTSRWFNQRAKGLTPSEIVQAEVVEDEYYNNFLNISAEYPTASLKEYL